MLEIAFYAHTEIGWVKREEMGSPSELSALFETSERLEREYNMKHWAIPVGIDPNDFPELLKFEITMKRYTKHYTNDFYLFDVYYYLQDKQKDAIWALRDTGTHYITLEDGLEESAASYYKSCIKANKYFYLINGGKAKKIDLDKAISLIEDKVIRVA